MDPKYYMKAWERIENNFFTCTLFTGLATANKPILAQCSVSIPLENVRKPNDQRFSNLFRGHGN